MIFIFSLVFYFYLVMKFERYLQEFLVYSTLILVIGFFIFIFTKFLSITIDILERYFIELPIDIEDDKNIFFEYKNEIENDKEEKRCCICMEGLKEKEGFENRYFKCTRCKIYYHFICKFEYLISEKNDMNNWECFQCKDKMNVNMIKKFFKYKQKNL